MCVEQFVPLDGIVYFMRRAELSRVEKVNLAKLLSLALGLKAEDFDTKQQERVWHGLASKEVPQTENAEQGSSSNSNSNKRKRDGDEDALSKGSTDE